MKKDTYEAMVALKDDLNKLRGREIYGIKFDEVNNVILNAIVEADAEKSSHLNFGEFSKPLLILHAKKLLDEASKKLILEELDIDPQDIRVMMMMLIQYAEDAERVTHNEDIIKKIEALALSRRP